MVVVAGKMASFTTKACRMKSYKQQFADNLKQLREAKGLTLRSAADAMASHGGKCNHATWHHWESGVSSPAFDLLPFIAKTLGKKHVSELFP